MKKMEEYNAQINFAGEQMNNDEIPLTSTFDPDISGGSNVHSAFLYEKDYGNDVFRFFRLKRDHHELSYNMITSTSAKIRKECLDILPRCTNHDIRILRNYLRCRDDDNLYELLKNMESDRFRPLNYYIQSDGQQSRSLDNIELLAVLIDYGMRPFTRYFSQLQKKLKLRTGTPDLDSTVVDNLVWHNGLYEVESQIAFSDNSDYEGKKAVLIELPSGTKIHIDSCETELILKLASLDFTSFHEGSIKNGRLPEN